MRFRNLCLIIALVFSTALIYAPSAEAGGFFDFFFPSGQKGPSPADTLKAPFSSEDDVIVDMDSEGNASNITPLHLRHRPNKVITKWVQHNIPDLLSYQARGYEQQYTQKIVSFSKIGLGEYIKFLQERNFLTTLKTGRYDIAGFIVDYPVVLNEAALNGSYSWLYQVNVMITYIESGVSYKERAEVDAITQEFVITFQVGRHKEAANDHGILIQTWNVRPRKKSN